MQVIRLFAFVLVTLCVLVKPGAAQTTVTQTCHGSSYPVLQGDQEICSYTAQFTAVCNNTDLWNQWTVNASPPTSISWAITPWENHWIKIVGHEITDATPNDGHAYWQIGSGYVADIQGGIGTENHGKTMYPSGLVWMFPPIGYASGLPIKDLHGSCSTGTASVLVTLYYVDASALVPPPPPPPLCTTFDALNPADKAAGITLSNANLTATSNGAASHQLARAVAGIAPSTLRVHYEWTIGGMGSAAPVDVFGLQDGAVATNTQLASAGTGFGVGYNTGNGFAYSSNFTPASGAAAALPNGTYAMDYDSFSGVATITGPGGYSVSRTRSLSTALFPAFSMYGPAALITFNFGASLFTYPVPSGYQAGLCQ